MHLESAHRIVIKIGSSLLLEHSHVHTEWLASLAGDIAMLRRQGKQVVLVSSGAAALGRPLLSLPESRPLKLDEKQAASACGQALLMQAFQTIFAGQGIPIAQVLLTLDDSEHRRRFLNVRSTLTTLLGYDVLPIVNENDSVGTRELKVGDNDRLAARIAQMVGAEVLILLSDIDGIYTANPRLDPAAEHIPRIDRITPELLAMAGGSGTTAGTGGMATKLQAAQIAMQAGCHMVICQGGTSSPITALMEGARCSWFTSDATPASARKRWIAGSLSPSGRVVVDAGAAEALQHGNSLLPAGVMAIHGMFDRGDTVEIREKTGTLLGYGIIAYAKEEAVQLIGKHTQEIENILGYSGRSALIHRDDLVITQKADEGEKRP